MITGNRRAARAAALIAALALTVGAGGAASGATPADPSITMPRVQTSGAVSPPALIAPGPVTWTFSAVNSGNVALGVTMTALAEVRATSNGPVVASAPLTVNCPSVQPVSLQPADVLTCTASYTVPADQYTLGGSVTLVATSSGEPTGGGSAVTGQVSIPTLMRTVTGQGSVSRLPASASPAFISSAGQQITFISGAVNSGDAALTGGFSISNTVVTSSVPAPPGPIPATCPVVPDTLQSFQTVTGCTSTYQVTQQDLDTGWFGVNQATTAGPVRQSGVALGVLAQANPALSVVKTADRQLFYQAGEQVKFTVVATNSGNITLNGVSVADPQLAGLTCDATAAALAPGGTLTCTGTYTVTAADVTAGTIRNTAEATGAPVQPVQQIVVNGQTRQCSSYGTCPPARPASVSASASAEVAVAKPGVSLVKSADPVSVSAAGQSVVFTMVAANTGNVPLSGVVVSDPLPGLSPLVCGSGSPVVLDPGAEVKCTATYTATQADVDAGKIANTATVSGTDAVGRTFTAPASATVTAAAAPGLQVVKTADRAGVAAAGDRIVYSFTATNTGNVTLSDVRVADALPGLSPVTCATSAPVSLAPGAKLSCTASYTVTAADIAAGGVSNTASATGATPKGETVTSAAATVKVVADPPAQPVPPSGGGLPGTGAGESTRTAAAAALLFGAGAGLVLFARRRRA